MGVLSEGMVGRMCFEPVRAGESAQVAELDAMGACRHSRTHRSFDAMSADQGAYTTL